MAMGYNDKSSAFEVVVMKRFSLLLAVLTVAIWGAPVAAQQAEEESAKDFMEVAVFGGGALPMGGLTDWSVANPVSGSEELGAKFGFNFGLDVGHFLTPNLVVGITATYARYGIDSKVGAAAAMNHQTISPAAYLKYYFQGESNFLPYFKMQAGVDVVKFATLVYDTNVDYGSYVYRELSYHPAFAFGFGAGAMYYTFDYGGVFAEANYHTGLTKNVIGKFGATEYKFGATTSVFDIHAGLKVFFGGE